MNNWLEFSPHLSTGLKNEVLIELEDGTEIKCNFLQTKHHRIANLRHLLIEYHKMGKIAWLQLLNILEIQEYHEIQGLKKEISKSST